MDQAWFEMRDLRKRRLADAVWVSLRASRRDERGSYGYLGYKSEFFGAGSIMVPLANRRKAEGLGWSVIGLMHEQRPHAFTNSYKPADVYQHGDEVDLGIDLVLVQQFGSGIPNVWHLHQDLVIALELLREGDTWVCPNEGFIEVVHLKRYADGKEALIEIRAEFLRDYLAARRMALKVNSYRSRHTVIEDASHIDWPDGRLREKADGTEFQAHVLPIHEGGHAFGAQAAVFKVWRTDVDQEADVPVMGEENDSNTASESSVHGYEGRKLFDVRGEVWIEEWVEPAAHSVRVRGDKVPSSCSFIVDASGARETAENLNNEEVGRWLWFLPAVIRALVERRGFALDWYTRETGGVGSPGGYSVHFGLNSKDLITVYAYDVARLPEWQRRIWHGFNTSPDGGVSAELLTAHVHAAPANTLAPEHGLKPALAALNEAFMTQTGRALLKEHNDTPDILRRAHRFRATDRAELLALAKDLARLTADSIDVAALHAIAPPAKGEKLGSLRSLERVLATFIQAEPARKLVQPLVGVYELRLGDAHLPSSKIGEAFELVGVDRSQTPIRQAEHLIGRTVVTLFKIAEVIEHAQLRAS